MIPRAPVLVAIAVCAAGFASVWLLGGPFDGTPDEPCGALPPEGAAYHVEPAAWPPGASRCVVELPGGTVRTHVHVPWLEWLSLVLLAAAAGVATAAARDRRDRLALAWAAAWLGMGAAAAYFVGAGVGLAVAAIGALPLILRAARGPRLPRGAGPRSGAPPRLSD